MITTPVIEQYNRVDLPDQSSTVRQPPPPVEDKYITIDASGAFSGQRSGGFIRIKVKVDNNSESPAPTIHIRG